MAESEKPSWFNLKTVVMLAVLIFGGGGTFAISNYRINQLEEKYKKLDDMNLSLLQSDVKDTKSLVRQIAKKMGILVPES